MKNKKLLSKILGMTLLLVMMLLPMLNVNASYAPALLYISAEEKENKFAYTDKFDTVGEYKNNVTLNEFDSNAKAATIALDKDAKLAHITTEYENVNLTINLDGDNEIAIIDSVITCNIKGKGTLTISSLAVWGYEDGIVSENGRYTYENVTEEWVDEHIIAEGKIVIFEDGKTIIADEESEEPEEPETPEYVLSTEDAEMEFISDEPFDENLTLVKIDVIELIEEIEDEDILTEIKEYLDGVRKSSENKTLLGFYDISVVDENNDIVPMENGNFKIRIKMTDEMKVYDFLVAAYINYGEIEEYIDVTIDGDYLEFTTSHLSEYAILGEIIDNVENPNTVDHIGLYIIIALAGLTGLLISFKSMKNEA